MNISIPPGGENPPTKEPSTREPTKTEGRENPEHPGEEIKETTPLNPIECLPQKLVYPTKTARKAEHQDSQKQTKRVT